MDSPAESRWLATFSGSQQKNQGRWVFAEMVAACDPIRFWLNAKLLKTAPNGKLAGNRYKKSRKLRVMSPEESHLLCQHPGNCQVYQNLCLPPKIHYFNISLKR